MASITRLAGSNTYLNQPSLNHFLTPEIQISVEPNAIRIDKEASEIVV